MKLFKKIFGSRKKHSDQNNLIKTQFAASQEHDDNYYSIIAENMRKSARRGHRRDTEELLDFTPVEPGQHIIDIGLGTGMATYYYLNKGLKVTAIGKEFENYGLNEKELRAKGVNIVDCYVENMQFDDEIFDACWMSHILEHTLNPGIALQNVWRILKPEGWLFILVPPYKPQIVGGHVTTGWNLGQLMYTLLITNFNIREGHFVKHGYNIAAFVRKANHFLPTLHSDIGDIEALTNYWPMNVKQGFDGDLKAINWPP